MTDDRHPPMFLSGPHVFLAPMRLEDTPVYLAWFNDREVCRYLSFFTPITREGEAKALVEMTTAAPEQAIHLAIWRKKTPRLIGNLSLMDIDHRRQCATLGIVIGDKTQWSRGYGREAMRLLLDYGFGTLNLRKVILNVYAPNARAIKAYRALGFTEAGRYRAHQYIEGEWVDEILMECWKPGLAPKDGE